MSSEAGSGSRQPVNLRFVALFKGNRFDVTVLAVKGHILLMKSQRVLPSGEKIVMFPLNAGTTAAFSTIQLFGVVSYVHEHRQLHEVMLEKAVSPKGTTVLIEYMQSSLGILLNASKMSPDRLLSREMCHYYFATESLVLPGRGEAPPDPQQEARAQTQPIGVRGTTSAARTGPVRLEAPSPSSGLSDKRTQPINADAFPERSQSGKPTPRGVVEDGDHVIVYGVRLKRSDWEMMENLQVKASWRENQVVLGHGRGPAVRVNVETSQDDDSDSESASSAGEQKKKGRLSGFMDKVVGRMVDQEPDNEGSRPDAPAMGCLSRGPTPGQRQNACTSSRAWVLTARFFGGG